MLEVDAHDDLRPLLIIAELEQAVLLHRQQKLGELLVRGLLHVQLQVGGANRRKIKNKKLCEGLIGVGVVTTPRTYQVSTM